MNELAVTEYKEIRVLTTQQIADAYGSNADTITKNFNRNKDITARIGGDEFAVFVGREITREETDIMLNKFMELFRTEFASKYSEQGLSISVGVAPNKDDISYTDLYKKADKALYKVKDAGKDGFGF